MLGKAVPGFDALNPRSVQVEIERSFQFWSCRPGRHEELGLIQKPCRPAGIGCILHLQCPRKRRMGCRGKCLASAFHRASRPQPLGELAGFMWGSPRPPIKQRRMAQPGRVRASLAMAVDAVVSQPLESSMGKIWNGPKTHGGFLPAAAHPHPHPSRRSGAVHVWGGAAPPWICAISASHRRRHNRMCRRIYRSL